MKKIMISLLMVAATFNAMAVTYSGKAKLTLTAADNESCSIVIAESADLNDGLNNGYYAEFNDEGKDVQLYVVYGGVKYAHFGSNAATLKDMQLGIKTNASTAYTLTASNVTGTLKVRINGVDYTITDGMSENITLAASSTLPAAGDEDKYKVQPSAPAAPSICFNNNILEVKGYAGKKLKVMKGADVVIAEAPVADDDEAFDLSAQTGRLVVTLDGKDYQIDANPTVKAYTPAP